MRTPHSTDRFALTVLLAAAVPLLLAGCTDQQLVEPEPEPAAQEGILSAEAAAEAREGPTVSASVTADVIVTDGEVCHLIDFEDVCHFCAPEAPPGAGVTFSDNWVVDTHVASLRKKLEDDPEQPTYLHSVRGVGYRLDVAEPES